MWGCSFVSKKRTRSGSNVSSRVGKDQRSIHFTSLLDDLKSSKNCPRNLFSGSNFSPEKSSPEKSSRFLSRKSVLRPALRRSQGPIFETKNRAIFLESFSGEEFREKHYCPYNFVTINWLWSAFIFPELEHL